MSIMQMTDTPGNYNTKCRSNQQEQIYDVISEDPANNQTTVVNKEIVKTHKCCTWPLLLTAVLSALIAAALSTSIAYFVMKMFSDLNRLNTTIDNKEHDLKRTLATLTTKKKELERLNTSLNIKKQEVEDIEVTKPAFNCGNCKPPWMALKNQCYYFSNNSLTWKDAQSNCLDLKSNLVKIDNMAENNWLISVLKDKSITDKIWIGANDIAQSNNWVWVTDNSTLTFTAWDRNKPSSFKPGTTIKEDCGNFFEEFKGRGWNDENCFCSYRYICKRSYD